MYKVEIRFNPQTLTVDDMNRICEQTDQIFREEGLDCASSDLGKRIYLDRGREQDYGRFWAAIFALKNTEGISKHLQECFWYNGNEKENLITEFMRN